MSDPKHPPAFMIYPADFSSDGVVEAMTTQEVGAYWLLLCKAWFETPVGSIPDDDLILARWARLSAKQWASVKPMVLKAFTRTDSGRFQQKRMALEYQKILAERVRRSHAGAKGADKRWHGSAIGLPSVSHQSANADALAKHSFPFPSSFPSPSTEVNTPHKPPTGGGSDGEAGGPKVKPKKPSCRTAAFERWYAVYPKRVGPEQAARAFQVAIKRIAVRHADDRNAALEWLIAVTGEFAISPKGRSEFCWNPATFLNQGHYDDDKQQWQRGDGADKAIRGGAGQVHSGDDPHF